MKKIYMILAAMTLLSMSLNAQLLLTGWDCATDGQTFPSTWTVPSVGGSGDFTNSYWFSGSSGGTFTIPATALQNNSTVTVKIVAGKENSNAHSISVNGDSKGLTQALVEYVWDNVSATDGLTITYSDYYVDISSIKVYATITDPTITASTTSVEMNAAPGASATQTVTVTGLNLTEGITATISGTNAALFSVSPASLGTTGGDLTITYSPTAEGTHTATITLASTGADPVTINLTGTSAAGTTYQLVTDPATQLVDGKKYIVVGNSKYAMGALSATSGFGTPVPITDNGNGTVTVAATESPMVLTLHEYSSTYTSGYTFTLDNGSYLRPYSSSSTNLTTTTATSDQNCWITTADVKPTGGYAVKWNYLATNRALAFRESSSVSARFCYYATSNMTAASTEYFYGLLYVEDTSTPPTPTPELTAPANGTTVNVGTNEGSGVSTTINVSGNDLTENLTVSVNGTGFEVTPTTISAADANAGTTVTVTYTGTDANATGTLTISSGEVSTTVNLTASYVQVVPTVAISPASQTINDAAAGDLTVTGTNVTGNISVSAGTDWTVAPASLSNTGGQVSVSYTGRALSATTTVTASANGATDATATVNYVADLYIVTDNGVQDQWDFNNGTHMTYNESDGSYTATFTANADNTFILFARKLGDGVTWNTRYVFGPDSDGDWWLNGTSGEGTIDTNDDDPIKIVNGGTYTITINSDGTFTITATSAPVQVPELITPVNGSTVFVGTTSVEEPSVSKVIAISGNYLTKDLTATISGEGFSFLTRDMTIPYADVNAATASVTVVYSGTAENTTGTLTLSSDEVSATVNLTASYRKPAVLTDEPAGYVVQDVVTVDRITTGIIETLYETFHGEVVDVIYYNALGMSSKTPFEGINIVVTRYSDGTSTTAKVVR